MLHFRDTNTRKSVMDSVTADLLRSLENAPVPGARPKSFGGKCDLLALDSGGRLLTVEVKPRGVSTIVWAPAQAIVYARLLHLRTRHDPQAAEIISGMMNQRQELRLLASRTPRPLPMPEVLPVVAVQRGMSQKHRERLLAVRKHLEEHGIEEAAKLQIYEVTLAGRLLNASASVLRAPGQNRADRQSRAEPHAGKSYDRIAHTGATEYAICICHLRSTVRRGRMTTRAH
jgi:hypothetical protein